MAHEGEAMVIDEDLIKAACDEERKYALRAKAAAQGTEMTAAAPLKISEIMNEVDTLRLSFKNIVKIDNLTGFEKLTTLCLDNNGIEDICNLEACANLKWLDLSFNKITEIKGLGALTQLEDLSLYNNAITELKEGCSLEKCTKLHCFSIGNNKLDSLSQLIFLRRFKNLKLLNLEGNPVCAEAEECRFYVLAHLKALKYLDYQLVHEHDVEQAREQYQDELLEIEEKESIADALTDKDRERVETSAMLRGANLEVVELLFEQMFSSDTENDKLKLLPGHTALYEDYRESFQGLSLVFRNEGLARAEERKAEYALFEKALAANRLEMHEAAVALIGTHNKKRKRVFAEARQRVSAGERVEAPFFAALQAEAEQLAEDLIDKEVQQGEQFKELNNTLDDAFTKLLAVSSDSQQTYFRGIEELQEEYNTQLTARVNELLEQAANGDLPAEVDLCDAAKAMLQDRDMCVNACVGSHDIHMSELLTAEDHMRVQEQKLFKGQVEGNGEGEAERRRKRVQEIKQLSEYYKREVKEFVAAQEEEEEEDA